jgi:hypothetical protein
MKSEIRKRITRFDRSNLIDIAIHEAAHAVLAWVTGRRIERLAMVSDEQYSRLPSMPDARAGCLVVGPLPPGVDLKDEKYRVLADREAMIALAGKLASLRYRGASRWDVVLTQSDLEGLSFAASHAGDSQERLNSYLDRLAAKTTQYLDAYWPHVEALADALLRHRVLSGEQVMTILRGVER